MKSKLDIRIIIVFLIISVFLTISFVYTFSNSQKYLQASKKLQQTSLMMLFLSDTKIHVEEMVASYRGYAITGSNEFFESYQKSLSELKITENKLLNLKIERTNTIFDSLHFLINELQGFGQQVIDRVMLDGKDSAIELVTTEKGQTLKSKINALIPILEGNGRKELRVLEFHQQQLAENATRNNYILTAIGFVIVVVCLYALQRQLQKRRESELTLYRLNEELEDQVQQKTSEIRQVFERITDAFIAYDKNWRVIYINGKAADMLGIDRKALIGKNFFEEFPALKSNPIYDVVRKAMKSQEYQLYESYLPHINKRFENHVYPAPEGLSVFSRDITIHKELQKAEHTLNQQLKAIFNNTADAILVTNDDGQYIEINPTACRMLGYSKEEFQTLNVHDLVQKVDSDEMGINHWDTFKDSGAEAGIVELRKKDGGSILCRYKATANILPGVHLSILTNVTDTIKAEQKLRESESRLADAQEIAKVGSWETDLSNLQVTWSAELYRIFEIENIQFALSHEKFLEYVHPDDRLMVDAAFGNSLSEPEIFHRAEHRVITAQKNEKTVEEKWRVFFSEGKPVRALGTCQDITQRKKSEEEIERAQSEVKKSYKQLQELYARLQNIREEERIHIAREIHDELGQQLTGLKMDLVWLSRQVSKDQLLSEKISEIVKLVDETVKAVRRIASQLRPGILEDFGIIAALEWQSAEFGNRTGIESTFESKIIDDELDLEKSDAINVFRIHQETLTNVMRHSKATRVRTRIEKTKKFIKLVITDNGKGFDENALNQKQSLGIVGMKERAFMLGGKLSIRSGEPYGVTVILKIPARDKTLIVQAP